MTGRPGRGATRSPRGCGRWPASPDAATRSRALTVKELGGTGRRHDWSVSARIRAAIGLPLFLAGGLVPENAEEAIGTVRPFALDVCSGVRRDGRLDPERLARFFAAVRAAA